MAVFDPALLEPLRTGFAENGLAFVGPDGAPLRSGGFCDAVFLVPDPAWAHLSSDEEAAIPVEAIVARAAEAKALLVILGNVPSPPRHAPNAGPPLLRRLNARLSGRGDAPLDHADHPWVAGIPKVFLHALRASRTWPEWLDFDLSGPGILRAFSHLDRRRPVGTLVVGDADPGHVIEHGKVGPLVRIERAEAARFGALDDAERAAALSEALGSLLAAV